MINQKLIDYIRVQLSLGTTKEEIKKVLLANGWQEVDIEEAFNFIFNTNENPQFNNFFQTKIIKLPSSIELFKQSFLIFKKRIKTFLGINLFYCFFIILLFLFLILSSNLFLTYLVTIGVHKLSFIDDDLILPIALAGMSIFPGPDIYMILYWILPILVVILSLLVGSYWVQLALLYAIKENQYEIGIKESYLRVWKKIPSFFWTLFLLTFINVGGFSLFLIPGIVFVIWFILTQPVFISENLKGMNAILKSREYVRGYGFKVFWYLLSFGIFIGLVFAIIIFLFNFFLKVINFDLSMFSTIIQFIIFILFILLFFVLVLLTLFYIYIFLIYENLKALKGSINFTPTTSQKLIFIIIGILGFLISLIVQFH